MANVAFQNAISVADLTALKAIPSSDRANNSLRVVVSPDNNLPPSWFIFNSTSTINELFPAITIPNDNSGRWIMVGTPIVISNQSPSLPPPMVGMRWIYATQIWESTGTNNVSDWVELTTGSSGGGTET